VRLQHDALGVLAWHRGLEVGVAGDHNRFDTARLQGVLEEPVEVCR
jgi:hypothetical protein